MFLFNYITVINDERSPEDGWSILTRIRHLLPNYVNLQARVKVFV